jgi:hypothetical protein
VSGDVDVVGLREGRPRVSSAHAELSVPHVSVGAERRLRARGGFADNGRHLGMNVTVRGDLVVDRTPRSTRVKLGGVEVERGNFTLFDRGYQIVYGEAKFDGPTPVGPSLDIEVLRERPAQRSANSFRVRRSGV